VLLIAVGAAGCGSAGGHFNAKGRVVRGGKPYVTQKGEGLRIFFAPVEARTPGKYDSFAAVYRPDDGTFQVVGKDGTGLPPGQYHVSLQLMKDKEDLFKGKLMGKQSPYTFDVSRGGEELVIDLDKVDLDASLTRTKP
jgi:hypothetical protein